jgi:hypothetical protein
MQAQTTQILDYLMTGKTISPAEALVRTGSFRLAARINDLRNAGWDIETEMKKDPRTGRRYARYRLIPPTRSL